MFDIPEKHKKTALFLAVLYPFAVAFVDGFFPVLSCFPNLYHRPPPEVKAGIWLYYALVFLGPPLVVLYRAIDDKGKRAGAMVAFVLAVPPLLFAFMVMLAFSGMSTHCSEFMPTLRALSDFFFKPWELP